MKKLKLSLKLAFGFGLVTLVAVLLGGLGYYGANRNAASIDEIGAVRLPSVEAILKIKEVLTAVKSVQRTLLQRDISVSMRQRQYDLAAKATETWEHERQTYEPLPQTPEEAALWKEFVPTWQEWQKGTDEFLRLSRQLDALNIGDPVQLERNLAIFRGQHYQLQLALLKSCVGGAPLPEGGEDASACAFGKWKASQKIENPEIVAALKAIDVFHHKFHAAAKSAKEKIRAGDIEGARKVVTEEMEPEAKQTFERFDRMQQTAVAASELFDKLNYQAIEVCRVPQLKATELLDKIADINVQVADAETKNARAFGSTFKTLCWVSVLAGILLAIVLAFSLTRSIVRPVRSITNTLAAGADQVASAAGQVSSSSQSLAEGASEQAASIEETSASIEEMASMTKRNAENAIKANELARKARTAAEKGSTDMQAMSAAMDGIKASSDEIAKIIKTIDEIAFQTNILALNAAVEAARAGEAGMGFAVVADEVRNLAQRSAQAAKETSEKIEGAIVRTGQGVELSAKVAQALSEIVTQVRQVDELASEVASASNEQSSGTSQVSVAVSQMDKVTQSNAASAEESASAAEELNSQAEVLKEAVRDLTQLVEGGNRTSTAGSAQKALALPRSNKTVGTSARTTSCQDSTATQRAEIPMPADFKSF